MKILEVIHNGVWAIHPMTAEAYLPVVANLMRGDFRQIDENAKREKPEMVRFYSSMLDVNGSPVPTQGNQGNVAVYDIQGAITKADQYCGPDGTVSLMRAIRMNDNDPSVVGHLFNLDSGGGEATNIEEVSKMIRYEIKKPKVGCFNGLNCSAAYGISCAFDELYAVLGTDIVGSVGVMMTVADWQGYFEKQGLTIHNVYADQSTEKNADFHEAQKGNFDSIKANLLNPFAESFIALVKEMRPQTAAHEAIFTGKTYMAQDAIKLGMIDGFKSFNESVQRVFELSNAQNSNNTPQNSSSKNKTNMKILGIDFGAVAKADNGDVTLTAEQYAKLEAASTTANANSETITAVNAKVEAMETQMTTLIEAVNGLKAWADETPAAKVATPQPPPKEDKKPEAIEKLNTMFAGFVGQKA